jgi:hypothetical protein
VEQDYFRIDPVVIAGRNRFLPIDWLTVEHDKPEARHLFAEAESYGVGRHGITLPIRGPAGERALFHDHRECDGRIGTGGHVPISGISIFWRTTFTIAPCAWPACGLTIRCDRYRIASNNACNA